MVNTFNRKIQTHEGRRMNFNTTNNGTPMNQMGFGETFRQNLLPKKSTDIIDDQISVNPMSKGSARIDFIYQ